MGHRNFLAFVTAGNEPQSFKEVVKDLGWREAMQKEIRALEDNCTWTMETVRALGSRWVYKVKHNSDESIECFKARLLVFGYHQVAEIDYTDTFTPLAKMVIVYAFLAVAAVKNWELH